jgi:glycosyltransferase involved in cell wall biosynthesis
LADGLAAIGERVVVATKVTDPRAALALDLVEERPRDGLTLLRFPRGSFYPDHWARELDELEARLIGREPNVVHAMGSLRFGLLALAVGRRFGAAVVYGMHGADVNAAALEAPGQLAAILRGADALLAVSRDLAERARSMSAVARPVIAIPNAAPVAEPRERGRLRAEMGMPDGVPIVGARLGGSWVKGPDRLQRILTLLSRRYPGPLGLCSFGAPDDGQITGAWQSGSAARDRPFRHLGTLAPARVLDALAAVDLLVIASNHEGTPNLLLEAFSVGTPVASTPAGGCPELLDGSGAGILLSWDEAEAAAAIAGLLDSEDLTAMRERAPRHLGKHFSPERELGAVVDVYRSLVGTASPSVASPR